MNINRPIYYPPDEFEDEQKGAKKTPKNEDEAAKQGIKEMFEEAQRKVEATAEKFMNSQRRYGD